MAAAAQPIRMATAEPSGAAAGLRHRSLKLSRIGPARPGRLASMVSPRHEPNRPGFGLALVGAVGSSLLGALVPEGSRARLEQRWGGAPNVTSLLLGMGMIAGGLGAYGYHGVRFARGLHSDHVDSVLAWAEPHVRLSDHMGVGLWGWISWNAHPLAWLFLYLAGIGAIRCLAYAIEGKAIGDPLLLLADRLWHRQARRRALRRRKRHYGPQRPDRLLRHADGRLSIVRSRPQPDWDTRTQLTLGNRIFQIESIGELPDRQWHAVAYRLRERRPHEPLNRLRRYAPPSR